MHVVAKFKEESEKKHNNIQDSVVDSNGDSLSLIAIKNDVQDEGENIQTSSIFITHNVHPAFTVHTMLFAVHDLIKNSKMDDVIDVGLSVKIPKELQKEIGEEKVSIFMGEDLGLLSEITQNRIADGILSYNIDRFLGEFLKKKAKKL